MREEFEKLTGIYPTARMYRCIEDAYMDFDGDKIAFCKAYKENQNGLAESIRNAVNNKIDDAVRKSQQTESMLRQEISRLKTALEKEQEWTLYEIPSNVKQSQYERLAKDAKIGNCAHYMTDEEAIALICDEFDFDPGKVTILHDVNEYEINRHCQTRMTGKKIDRRPIYCATDYYYIRFNTTHWCYEAWNGELI